MAQTVDFMFSSVAYRATVYRTGLPGLAFVPCQVCKIDQREWYVNEGFPE